MKKITAVGEILYDVYPDKKRLGGAPFNFIYHVWKLTGKANFISSVGNDENGREIFDYLSSIGFDTESITIDKKHATGTVKVALDENKIPCFVISPESSYDYIELNEKTKNVIEQETDLLYFGTLTTRNSVSRKTVLSLLQNKNLKFFCDLNLRHNFYSKELVETMLRATHIIKLNDAELYKLQQFFDLDQSRSAAIRQLINEYDIEIAALTLGEDGAEIYTAGETNKYKSKQTEVADTLGAGDAYAAVFCIGYLYNLPLKKINELANEFASEICRINGALPTDDSIYKTYRSIFSALQ